MSCFFNALVRVSAQMYANTWHGGIYVPPTPPGQEGLRLQPDVWAIYWKNTFDAPPLSILLVYFCSEILILRYSYSTHRNEFK